MRLDTIFAPITSSNGSAVCVIRISGENTLNCLKSLGVNNLKPNQISFQKIVDKNTNEVIDETLVSFFKSPNSYTGEDVAEISIHSSSFILKKIFKILSKQKFTRIAEAGEFSKRALLNGKLNITQVEAIPDLIASETEMQHQQAMKQLSGELGKIYQNWYNKIISTTAQIEAIIDFPEDDLPKNIIQNIENEIGVLHQEIKQHLDDKGLGKKIKDGLNIVILGATNSGKSSLINFLAKSEIAIVSKIAGTTRDIIETNLSIAGIPVKIFDTAGIRKTKNSIEKEGITRALKKADEADIKIFMVDATKPFLDHDLIDDKTIVVLNKIDLKTRNDFNYPSLIKISLEQKLNLSILIKEIEKKVVDLIPTKHATLITQERHRVVLENCLEILDNFSLAKNIEFVAEDLRILLNEIGKITGNVDIENILDLIFSSFCIGK